MKSGTRSHHFKKMPAAISDLVAEGGHVLSSDDEAVGRRAREAKLRSHSVIRKSHDRKR